MLFQAKTRGKTARAAAPIGDSHWTMYTTEVGKTLATGFPLESSAGSYPRASPSQTASLNDSSIPSL